MEKRRAYKTQQAQNEANKRYLENNPEKRKKFKISNYKSTCKSFIRKYSTQEDLEEIKKIIAEREIELKGE